MSGATHDLLNGGATLSHCENGGVGFLTAYVAFTLDTLGGSEQARIDGCGADRGADFPHGFPDCIKKGTAGILHEVPTVGDLGGVWQGCSRRERVTAAAVARHNGDLWLTGEPSLRRSRLAVRQQTDRLASLKVANDRSVSLVSPPRPIVDPDHTWRGERRSAASANDAQQGVVAHGEH